MKKDTIVWALRTFVGLALLAYVIYLAYYQIDIVPNKPWNYDLIVLIIVGLIAMMMIFVGIVKPCFKKPRLIQAFMGIFLILFPYYAGIQDNPEINQYLGDILRVIGSLALALSFGKFCVYEKCTSLEKQIESWEVEIIEVWDSSASYQSNKKKKDDDLEIIEA